MLSLLLEDPATKRRFYVYGDNGPTVRALAACFGPQVVSNHAIVEEELLGQEISYMLTEWGSLAEIGCP